MAGRACGRWRPGRGGVRRRGERGFFSPGRCVSARRRGEERGREGAAPFPPLARPLLLPPRVPPSLPAAPARLRERRPPRRDEGRRRCLRGGSWMKACASGRVGHPFGHEGDRGDSALPCSPAGTPGNGPARLPPSAVRASPPARPGPARLKCWEKPSAIRKVILPPLAERPRAEEEGEEAVLGVGSRIGLFQTSARPRLVLGSLRRCSSRPGGGGGLRSGGVGAAGDVPPSPRRLSARRSAAVAVLRPAESFQRRGGNEERGRTAAGGERGAACAWGRGAAGSGRRGRSPPRRERRLAALR